MRASPNGGVRELSRGGVAPSPQTAPPEGGPLTERLLLVLRVSTYSYLYIFVPSTGEDSAGAPTGITCDVCEYGLEKMSRGRCVV